MVGRELGDAEGVCVGHGQGFQPVPGKPRKDKGPGYFG